MEVGFLGLGIMGKAMALNLLRSGFEVTVWNRTLSKRKGSGFARFAPTGYREKVSVLVKAWSGRLRVDVSTGLTKSSKNLCKELLEHGASIGETPAAVVSKSKYTIGMLADPIAALSVVFEKNGVLEQIGEGKGYIDMSTVDADTSSRINEAIMNKGGRFLEAPVSGSKKPAEDGQLVILAAGDKGLYDEVVPAFNVLGKTSFFLGSVGSGAKMKLVVNMVMGSMMNALSEGLSLAGSSGLNQETLLQVLELGAIANPMFRLKGPAMIQGSYPPAFPLKHQQKDMRLALALGDKNAVSLPVAAAANEAFKRARSRGLGDLDFSAVHEVVKPTQISGDAK